MVGAQAAEPVASPRLSIETGFPATEPLADTAAGKTQRTEELCSRARRCAEIDTDIKQRQNAENELGNAVRLFFAETENEENASEDPQFLLLKQKFAEAEEELQNARRRYNAAVRDYNVALHTVPTCWIAKSIKAEEKIFFKTGGGETPASNG
jgi:LemA protein